VPGDHFGADDHVRIGFELSTDELAEGLMRVGQGVDRLKGG
jgi:hypothetical protein